MNFVSHGVSVYRCLLQGEFYRRKVRILRCHWCCEGALWMEWIHPGDMKALMEVSIITLPSMKFFEMVTGHRDVFILAHERAIAFHKESRALLLFGLGPRDVTLDLPSLGCGAEDGTDTINWLDTAFALRSSTKTTVDP